ALLRSVALRRLLLGSTIAVAGALVLISLGEVSSRMWVVRGHAGIQAHYREAGIYLRTHVPAGSTLAVVDAGAIPYYSGLYTIDYFCLADKHIARVPLRSITLEKEYGVSRNYRPMRVEPDYLRALRPDISEWR